MQANPTRYQVEAHWLWVLNSSLLVVLLTGLFSVILLRTLKNDVARYLQVDQIDQEEGTLTLPLLCTLLRCDALLRAATFFFSFSLKWSRCCELTTFLLSRKSALMRLFHLVFATCALKHGSCGGKGAGPYG